MSLDTPARAAEGIAAALSPYWTPELSGFLGRLWPMLIPLAVFLLLLSTWRASLREAAEPTAAGRATRSAVPEATSDARLNTEEKIAPPMDGAETAPVAPAKRRPTAATPPRQQVAPSPPRRVRDLPARPAKSVPPSLLARAAPTVRPGIDPPLRIDGLEADEVLTIIAAAPSRDGARETELTVAPSPRERLTRVLLGDACIAVVTGTARVAPDQLTLILETAAPAPAPTPEGVRARVIPLDAARRAARRGTRPARIVVELSTPRAPRP